MEFVDKIKALAVRVEKQKDNISTEEACKNAFVMPFLNALGYDVLNPEVVVPEFVADVGVKKGEKVDYAIKLDGKIIMIVECKICGSEIQFGGAEGVCARGRKSFRRTRPNDGFTRVLWPAVQVGTRGVSADRGRRF